MRSWVVAAAVRVARASASAPFGSILGSYLSGWRAYDRGLRRPPASASSRTRAMYWLSADVIKADEDKTYPGAFVASPTDPWGQSVPATTTHPGWTYRSVFARDGGGLAPYAAGRMVLAVNIHFPFYIGAGAIVLGTGILATANRLLNQAERVQAEQVLGVVEDQAEGVPVS